MTINLNFDVNYKGERSDYIRYKRGVILYAFVFTLLSVLIGTSMLSNDSTASKVMAYCFIAFGILCFLSPIYFLFFIDLYKNFSGKLHFVINFDEKSVTYRVEGTRNGEKFNESGSDLLVNFQKSFYVLTTKEGNYYIPASQVSADKQIAFDKLIKITTNNYALKQEQAKLARKKKKDK